MQAVEGRRSDTYSFDFSNFNFDAGGADITRQEVQEALQELGKTVVEAVTAARVGDL